jgi:hypothetical protein
MKNPELKRQHFDQLELIYELFHKHSQNTTIDTTFLKRLNKWAAQFKDEVIFLVEGKEYPISKTCLFSSKSSYLLDLFEFSEPDDGPIELPIDGENFQHLYRWLCSPSSNLFDNIEIDKVLTFLEVVCKFDIPLIQVHCNSSLLSRISPENVFLILDKLFLFKKRNGENGILFKFSALEDKIIEVLSSFHSIVISSCSDKSNWLLNPEKEIEIKITAVRKFKEILKKVEKSSFFKLAKIKLNINKIKRLGQPVKELLLTCFPNMETIVLNFEVTKGRKKSDESPSEMTSKIEWSFLTEFKNLKVIYPILPNSVTDDHVAIFLNEFPTHANWKTSFNLKSYNPLEMGRGSGNNTISTDNFIKLYAKNSPKTSKLLKQFRPYIEERHLQELIHAGKFDFESHRLNLMGLYNTTDQCVGDIISKMKNLEELKLDFANTSRAIFYQLFPQLAPRLKKLTLSLDYFQEGVDLTPLNPFIQDGQCKDLIIYIDKNSLLNNLLIPPGWIDVLRNVSLLRVEVKSSENSSLIPSKDSFKIKVKRVDISHDFTSRLFTCYSTLSNHFLQTPLIIDLSNEKLRINDLTYLSRDFPHTQELQYPVYGNDICPEPFSQFSWLKQITFTFFNFYGKQVQSWDEIISHFNRNQNFKNFKDLQNYPADLAINSTGNDNPPLEEFICKMEEIRALLPNFQALRSLPPEYRTSITDGQLLRLIPEKSHLPLDVTGMPLITTQGLLEIVKKFPKTKLICDKGESFYQEILNEKISLEECVSLLNALQNYQIPFFINPAFTQLTQKLTNPLLVKLLEANAIPPLDSLDLSDMPLMQRQTFVRLVNAIKPQQLILNHTPDLYRDIYSIATAVQTISLPFEAIKEGSFSEFFFTNFLNEGSNKKLVIHCEPSDLEWLNEEMILNLNRLNLTTHFLSPQMEIELKLKKVHIKLPDGTVNCTFSKDSPFLQALERLTSEAARKVKIDFNYTSNGDEDLPLEALMHHCAHFKELHLDLKTTGKLLNKKSNFEVLKRSHNLTKLHLHCDDEIFPVSPTLDILKDLRCSLKIFNPEFYDLTNLEDFLKKAKSLQAFFPSHHPFELVALSPELLAQFTDETLVAFKPRVQRACWDFSGMSEISYEGVFNFLEGLQFTRLKFDGCQKLMEGEALEYLHLLFPEVKITPAIQIPMEI